MKKIFLFIGPKNWIVDPDKAGGVVVLFEDLLSYCDEHNIKYITIDTNKWNYNNKLFAYISILFQVLIKIPNAKNVSLHGTANDYIFIAPFALIVAKLFGKKFVLRKFAGNFIDLYEGYPLYIQKIINFILTKADMNFFETKYLVNYFKNFNKNTFWFPNVRKKNNIMTDGNYKKKFIFVGSVNEEKGVEILCKASNLLTKEYSIDVYGVLDTKYTESFFDDFNVKYKGRLRPENVAKIMSEYDVLVLPSYREGYPGVIIEALSVGLPIVATKLDGIKEMLNDKVSVLIEPKNVMQLKEAIESFNNQNYEIMSEQAKVQFRLFDSDIQTQMFMEKLELSC